MKDRSTGRKPLEIGLLISGLILLTGLNSCPSSSPPAASAGLDFQKGMAFPTWQSEQYGTTGSDHSLSVLAQSTCTEWVQLVPTWYQEDRSSTAMFPDYDSRTATMESLIHAIQVCRSYGFKIMLKPHVDAGSGEWRGLFRPEDPGLWFENYTAMMVEYAHLARDWRIEILSVGTEFVELTTPEFTPAWREVIRTVDGVYGGPLVYSGNWGREIRQIEFWDDLDFIGIDAYFDLTQSSDPTLDDLLAAWIPYITEMEILRTVWQKPILLTEIGYRSIDGANMRPWDWEIGGETDLEEQSLCYQAVYLTFRDKPWLAGIYWWNWEPDPTRAGANDNGYTPRSKPAENVLKTWYCGNR